MIKYRVFVGQFLKYTNKNSWISISKIMNGFSVSDKLFMSILDLKKISEISYCFEFQEEYYSTNKIFSVVEMYFLYSKQKAAMLRLYFPEIKIEKQTKKDAKKLIEKF